MHGIAPHEYPRKSTFIDRYAQKSYNPFGGLDIVGIRSDTEEELRKILYPRMRRMLKAQVATDLPKKIRSIRWVDMDPKQKKAYTEMRNANMTTLNGEVLTAPRSSEVHTRMMQLAASYAHVDYEKKPLSPSDKCSCAIYGTGEHADICREAWKVIVTLKEPSPKLDALEEILDDLGDEPLVIAAE